MHDLRTAETMGLTKNTFPRQIMSHTSSEDRPDRIRIPQTGKILDLPCIQKYFPLISRPLCHTVISSVLRELGQKARTGEQNLPAQEEIELLCERALLRTANEGVTPVINATGIVLHTNLGRSPIPRSAWQRSESVNTGYSSLEFDLETGERGTRGRLARILAATLAGTEDALIANNNAAALLLALSTLAKDKEVIVSRGEQVQIGGGFRVPDILALSGARFREVGTTNVVTIDDYLAGTGPDTGCVLLVHSSNFAIRGFTEKPSPAALVRALPRGVPVLVDQGSGCTTEAIERELSLRTLAGSGVSAISFSADKLLGAPQAGILAGTKDFIARCLRNPLYRALRPGKTILSLLEACLVERLNGLPGPVCKTCIKDLQVQAQALLDALTRESAVREIPENNLHLVPSEDPATGSPVSGKNPWHSTPAAPDKPLPMYRIVESMASSGGGSGPDTGWPSVSLSVSIPEGSPGRDAFARTLHAELRRGSAPIIALLRKGEVHLDLAALKELPAEQLATLIRDAVARCPGGAVRDGPATDEPCAEGSIAGKQPSAGEKTRKNLPSHSGTDLMG